MRLLPTFLVALALAVNSVTALNEKKSVDAFVNFVQQFLSPNNAKVAASINSTLFSEDVVGTIDVSTNFDGRELSTEYLFGLFVQIEGDSNRPSLIGAPKSYEITSLMSTDNYTFGSVKFDFYYQTLNLHFPVQIDLWFMFNEQGQVKQYDVAFRRWAWATDTIAAKLLPQMRAYANLTTTDPSVIFTEFMIPAICGTAQKYCTGANKQYDSYDACAAFIRSRPVGQLYRMGEDNIACRNLHVPMVPYRPSVHCSHLGPSGGDMCVPRDYNQVVTDRHFPAGFIASKFATGLKG